MPVFAFLYRPTRVLSGDELIERSQRVREWTLGQRAAGRVRVVAVLDEGARVLRHDGAVDAPRDALAGCTLVEAADIDDALALAREFPGRAFGTDVEIRPVKTYVGPDSA